jgi:hypothetical protein
MYRFEIGKEIYDYKNGGDYRENGHEWYECKNDE